MGERIRAFDWAATPLGPVERWPQSLKTVVRIMLTSRQPIWVGWGPDLIKLYNDPYKAIVGGKHPDALGQPAAVVWREIWDVLGPRVKAAVENNEGTYDESLLLIMERNGYPEETYYTFSYSPVPSDEGGVGGIICANTDDTQRIISERQVKLLRTLAAQTADARTVKEACFLSASSLAQNLSDLPFTMIYLLDQEKQLVTLAGTSGIPHGHQAVPQTVALASSDPWPFAEVLTEHKACVIAGLDRIFDMLPTGAWTRPPHQAVAIPIAPSGQTGKAGVLIVGLNPFRLFDESYQGFLDLVAGQIAASLAHAQAYEEERKRAEALAEIDKAKTLFFSNISHELRTPLTLMLGPIEDTLVEAQTLSPAQYERTEMLHRNAQRLSKLVNALLDFSRIEAGRVQAVYEPTDLAALTADLASNFRAVIEKAGMQLTVNCPPLDAPAYIDHEMWEKIILNLLSNAFKYTLEGEIGVTLEQHETTVELAVKDTGVGIPVEELPHMFERFHRVQGTAGRTLEGTGIGLSLVRELVALHGGTISVTSILGRGSTFTISLPQGSAHLPQDRIVTQRTLASTAVNAQHYVHEALRWLAGTSLFSDDPFKYSPDNSQFAMRIEGQSAARILFADDNADMRDYVGRLLQQRYAVQTVADGQAALAAVKTFHPDLVLTDIMMPRMDGCELLQALRADQETQTIPVILLSARAGEEAQSVGMETGANDYLIKPFRARELLARVAAHLEIARLREATAQEVRAERERLYSLFQQAPAAIAVLKDITLHYELANPRYQQVFHRTEQQLIGKTMREAFPEIEGQGIFELLETAYTSGEPAVGNEVPITFDRSGTGKPEIGYFNFVAQPLRNSTGNVDRLMIHAIDVTEQIVASRRVQESEARFRTLADNIAQLAWMADETGWIFWYNQRWYDYTGTSLQEMQGWGWQQVHHPDHVARVVEKIRHCFATGEVWEDTFPLRGKDGSYRWFLSRALPIRDEQGKVIRWFGSNTDVTEQKQLEQKKDEFLGVTSHELKTPVTSLKAYTQLLVRRFRQGGDDRAAELLSKMEMQVNKLTLLIEDLLEVTKIESGKLQLHCQSFDYHDLVKEMVDEVQRTTSTHTIHLDLTSPISLTADRERIGQVLMNLLTNAIKYSPKAESVVVKTVQKQGVVITSVQDFGIGIPKEQQTHLFERFYRVEGEQQRTYPGLGLGLYITAEFVKRHQGSIWVASREGEGATFSFSLPLSSPAVPRLLEEGEIVI